MKVARIEKEAKRMCQELKKINQDVSRIEKSNEDMARMETDQRGHG